VVKENPAGCGGKSGKLFARFAIRHSKWSPCYRWTSFVCL